MFYFPQLFPRNDCKVAYLNWRISFYARRFGVFVSNPIFILIISFIPKQKKHLVAKLVRRQKESRRNIMIILTGQRMARATLLE